MFRRQFLGMSVVAAVAGISVKPRHGKTDARGANFEINKDGVFYYSGTPAAGNLTSSVAATAGTDRFGNAYAQGIASYGLVDFGACAVQADGVAFFAPRLSQAAPFVRNGFVANLNLDGTELLEVEATNGIVLDSPRTRVSRPTGG